MLLPRQIRLQKQSTKNEDTTSNHYESKTTRRSSGCQKQHNYKCGQKNHKGWTKHHGGWSLWAMRRWRSHCCRETFWCNRNGWLWRAWNLMWWHNFHNQFLAILAMILSSTDEVEGSRPIKSDSAVPIIKWCDGLIWVTMKVIPFLHNKNWVILVLKNCTNEHESTHYLLPHPFC